jgi:hypothetical protein
LLVHVLEMLAWPYSTSVLCEEGFLTRRIAQYATVLTTLK